MLIDIIKKEILDHLLSSKFVAMFIICSALILLSVYVGVGEYMADKKVYDDDLAWDALAMQPPNTYQQLLEGALKVYRAPRPLGSLVKGVEDAAGRVSFMNMTEASLGESKYQSNPLTSVFGTFDLIFIVKMVLSLFAILLIHDTICGEKEKGTLKQSLANSVPRDRLLLGKAIGGYISLIIPLLFPLLLGLIYLSLHPGIDLSGEEWQRLCLILLVFLLYLSVFFCLGLLVSSMTVRSSTSLLVLLFVWSVWGIVVPKASVIIAGMLQPIPVANEIYAQKTMESAQINQEVSKIYDAQLSKILVMNPDGRSGRITDPAAYQKIQVEMTAERNRRIDENNAKIDQDYQMRKDAQASLAKNISRISPAAALTFGATALAGTGTEDYNRFWKAVMDYKPVVNTWLRTNPDLRTASTNPNQALLNSPFKPIDPATLAGMPQPAIGPEDFSRSVSRILPDLISMAVMIVLLAGGAYFAFIRCDVR
jgi:ABC-type transport system involved in multi-copper enzyme maturation permease subunit